jgi:asparagine synthase (glutamine-hydrolysing)
MCGLAGIASTTGVPERVFLEQASARLRHRGPDSCGMMADQQCALVHRRLSILDVSGAASQPMHADPLPVWIAYNGEVYNYRSLRRELQSRGWKFVSDCDTEVVLKGYVEWGPDVVRRLRGMFALAIWDARERSLFLARDPFGIKPLFYTHLAGGTLVFGSEIKALRAFPAVTTDLNYNAFAQYLRYHYVPEPHSIYRHIHRLPASHCLLWKDGVMRIQPFQSSVCDANRNRPEPAEEEVTAVLADSVAAHMMSDVPVGVFLSGGVDSSLVAAMMRRACGERLHSFSIGFADRLKSADESEFASTVARHLHTDHHELLIDEDVLQRLPETLGFFDEPFGNPAALIAARLSEFAAQYVKVVLSGVGGDEFFGGYPRYLAVAANRALSLMPRGLYGLAARATALMPASTDRKWIRDRVARLLSACRGDPTHFYDNLVAYSTPEETAAVVNPELRDLVWRDEARLFDASIPGGAARAMDVDVASYLPGDLLAYTDRCAMAYSLEVRTPLVDLEVAHTARRLSLHRQVHGTQTKWVLKRIAARLVPPEVVYRKKKGFAVPIAEWLRRRPSFVDEVLSDGALRNLPELNPAGVLALRCRPAAGDNSAAYLLWAVASYVKWRANLHAQDTAGCDTRLPMAAG